MAVKFLYLLVVLLTVAGGCNRPTGPTAQGKAPDPPAAPAALTVVRPERGVIRHAVAQPGHIRAFEETAVYARIAGYVKEWKADIGDAVEAGQPLAVLSVPEMEAELGQKEALIREADSQIKLARAAEGVAETEHKRLKSQSERLAQAGRGGVLDQESVVESQYGFESAKARLEQARAEVGVRESKLDVAKKERDQVKAMLAYATLAAPYRGIVSRRNVNRGDFVQPATGAKGEPLFVVERADVVRVSVAVPEDEADWVRPGAAARVRVPALRGKEFSGKVARTSSSLDRKERTLVAEIDLPNPDGELRSGMYVFATLTAERAGVLTLPASAVLTQGDDTQVLQTFCYFVESGNAVKTPVRVGAKDGGRVEVLAKQAPGGGPWQSFTGAEQVLQGSLSDVKEGQAVTAGTGKP